ncbi:hypothetical protein BDR26DRAFT_906852 [Obelidium mucronatum]|nr:hypothetical protein BDR26DRAFT_906852 [Obelidium mucronatum]
MYAFDSVSGVLVSADPRAPTPHLLIRDADGRTRRVGLDSAAVCVSLVRLEHPAHAPALVVFAGLADGGLAAARAETPGGVAVRVAETRGGGVAALSAGGGALVATLGDGGFCALELRVLWLTLAAGGALAADALLLTRYPAAPQLNNTRRVLALNSESKWLPALVDAQQPMNTPCDRVPRPDPVPALRFISIGSNPMMAVLVSSAGSQSPADEMVQQFEEITQSVDKLATAVVGAMFSFTKSIFNSSSPTSAEAPADPSSPTGHFSTIIQASPAPFSLANSPASSSLIALLDAWGRVLIFNSNQCEILQIIKGARDAQMAWFYDAKDDGGVWYLLLLLGRGVLEFYRVIGSSFGSVKTLEDISAGGAIVNRVHAVSVGTDWVLVQSCLIFNGGESVGGSSSQQGSVVMVSRTSGTIKHIRIPFETTPANSPLQPSKPTEIFSAEAILTRCELECQNKPDSVVDFILGLADIRLQAAVEFTMNKMFKKLLILHVLRFPEL